MIGRLVIALLLANALWWAWANGWLQAVGLAPQAQAEPQRMAQQLRPEAVRVQSENSPSPAQTTPPAADDATPVPSEPESPPASDSPGKADTPDTPSESAAPAADNAPPPVAANTFSCRQVGVFDGRQADALRRAATARLPEGSWRLDEVQLPGRWMVYLKLPDAETVRTRRNELRAQGIDTDRPGNSFEPGLALGRFSTEDAAKQGLDILSRKGVRSLRVVQERRDAPGYLLRLPRADDAQQAQAQQQLRRQIGNREWRGCP